MVDLEASAAEMGGVFQENTAMVALRRRVDADAMRYVERTPMIGETADNPHMTTAQVKIRSGAPPYVVTHIIGPEIQVFLAQRVTKVIQRRSTMHDLYVAFSTMLNDRFKGIIMQKDSFIDVVIPAITQLIADQP